MSLEVVIELGIVAREAHRTLSSLGLRKLGELQVDGYAHSLFPVFFAAVSESSCCTVR